MRKPARTLLLVVSLASSTTGCVEDLDRAFRAGNDHPGPSCRSRDDGKKWNLGTGRVEDIKRFAPGFFTPGNGAWRRAGLAPELAGVSEVRRASINGAEAFELITRDAPYRIRAIRVDDKVAILATPAQCPQVVAVDRCVDDKLKTEISVGGVAPCIGPISVPGDKVTITMGNNELLKEQLIFGKPLMETTTSSAISFSIYLQGSSEPAARVERRVGDYSKATADEVLAFLRIGLEQPAGMLWRNVPEEAKTPATINLIVEARSQGIVGAASGATTTRAVNELIKAHPPGVLPGDDEAKSAIVQMVRTLVAEQVRADPRPEALFQISLYLQLIAPLTSERPDVSALEEKYGPLLHQSGYIDPKVQGSFMVLFPSSKYTRALEAEDVKENERLAAETRAQAAKADFDDAWTEVEGRGDELATLAYKLRFGHENFVPSRHNERGLASMAKYRQGLVLDAFCPAKRAFLQRASAAEYNRRSAEHCKSNPPTDVGAGGVEKVLTAECKTAFAIGC